MEIFLCSKVFRHCTVTGAQGGFQHVAREVPGHNSLAHSPQQNEAQPTVQHLLFDRPVLAKVLPLHLRTGPDRTRRALHSLHRPATLPPPLPPHLTPPLPTHPCSPTHLTTTHTP